VWIGRSPHDVERLNRLSFEASLWLPDDIVIEVSKRLTYRADAKDINELLVDVRRHLMGKPDAVEPGHIIHFNPPQQLMTVIEIRPHRWGWKAFESPGVEPVFPKKDQAIDYAQNRACFRSGEIRVLDSTGNIERTVAFSEANRKL
jgi:hypothetical protein